MVSEKPSFFFTVPAKNPRTLCCCQSVVIKRLEPDAIREKIRGAFEEIAAFPYQRVDTLVVLLAGHGRSVDGKYYYLPFDTHFGGGRDVFTDGISTDSWKEWVAGIAGSLVTETLRGNTKVQVLEFQGDWTKIARQGIMRGWVPHDAVKQLQ